MLRIIDLKNTATANEHKLMLTFLFVSHSLAVISVH